MTLVSCACLPPILRLPLQPSHHSLPDGKWSCQFHGMRRKQWVGITEQTWEQTGAEWEGGGSIGMLIPSISAGRPPATRVSNVHLSLNSTIPTFQNSTGESFGQSSNPSFHGGISLNSQQSNLGSASP